jgi:pimeloyl-ACP methyl ester carboxylesterase
MAPLHADLAGDRRITFKWLARISLSALHMPAIATDGVALSFDHTGAGVPVVCLHSSASSSAQWRRLAGELASRYHVLAVDLHGHGGTSAWPYTRPMRLADEVALLRPLLAALPSPIHLIGHSYGGAVAAKIALAIPERIQSLVLVEPVLLALLRTQGEHGAYVEASQIAQDCVSHVQAGRPAAAARNFVDYWCGVGEWGRLADHARVRVERAIPSVARQWEAIFADSTTLADYAGLRMPTLLLSGDHGPITARRVTELLAGVVPHAVHRVITGAGHMAPLTHAAPVNAAITAHLTGYHTGAFAAA